MHNAIAHGIHLFNTGKFFEAHETLEAAWLHAGGKEKTFLHGLIQVAAAFHHHQRGNPAGCRSLLEKGAKKLERFAAGKSAVDVAGLLEQLGLWQEYVRHTEQAATEPQPPLPHISRTVTSDG